MECKFWVGQKVVCVDDVPMPGFSPEMHGLTSGLIYTVREVTISTISGKPALRLREIYRYNSYPYPDVPYIADRFRPATDITIFKEIVAKVKNRDLIPAGAMQ